MPRTLPFPEMYVGQFERRAVPCSDASIIDVLSVSSFASLVVRNGKLHFCVQFLSVRLPPVVMSWRVLSSWVSFSFRARVDW